ANFYTMMGATDQTMWQNVAMRQMMFRITAVNATNHTVTVDKPLEWDVPIDSTSDGSAPILGAAYPSKIVPITVIEGVGLQNFYLTEDLNNMPRYNGTGSYTTGVDAATGWPTLNVPGLGVQPT